MKLKKIFYCLHDNNRGVKIHPINKHHISWLTKKSTIWSDPNFYILDGKIWTDIVRIWGYGEFAVSDRFRRVLEDNFCRRWNYSPINIIGTEQKYYIIYDLVEAGESLLYSDDYDLGLEIPKEKLINEPFCPPYNGLLFDVNSWDGSDMFRLKGWGHILCSPEVALLLQNNRITGYGLNPVYGIELSEEEKTCLIEERDLKYKEFEMRASENYNEDLI